MTNNKIQTFWLDQETIKKLDEIASKNLNLDSRSDVIREAIHEYIANRSHKAKRPSIKIISD